MARSLKIKPMRWFLRRRPELPPVKLDWEEIFDAMDDGLVVLNQDGMILKMNPGAEKLSGLSLDMVRGLKLVEGFPFNQEVWKILEPFFQERRSRTLREIEWHIHNGGQAVIDLLLTPLDSDPVQRGGWVLLLRDVSPLKKLQDELRRNDRLATAGTIASGLAHEIKNPLGGIRGAAQLVARKKNVTPDMKECLDIIIKETTRVDHLVSQLLNLASPKKLNLQAVNINELLNEILLLQQTVLQEHGVILIREFDPSLPAIHADPEPLTQALINFLRNACEAMSDIPIKNRRLRIRTRLQTDFRIKGVRAVRDFRMALVEIIDNGYGIEKANLDKIFLPFYTTKQSGSGLGMAIAQTIINQHEGILKVSSERNKGTTVSIYLRSVV